MKTWEVHWWGERRGSCLVTAESLDEAKAFLEGREFYQADSPRLTRYEELSDEEGDGSGHDGGDCRPPEAPGYLECETADEVAAFWFQQKLAVEGEGPLSRAVFLVKRKLREVLAQLYEP